MRKVLLVSMLILVLILGACTQAEPTEEMSSPGDTNEEETISAEDIKIGYIVKTLGNTFWQTYQQGAEAAAADLGVQVDVRDVPTEGDIKGQLDVAMAMVNQDYDAIVAASITNTNLIPAIAEANVKGIPWIVVSEAQDEDVLAQNDAYITAQVRLSFYEEGVIIGEYIAEQLNGEGQVGIIEGMAGTSAMRDRKEGVMDVFEAYPDIEIVASQPGDWQRELAREVAAAMIQANPEIDAIITQNDTMALGAAVAVEQAGKKGDILVTGDDGTPEAYEAIKNGDLAATVDGVAWQIAYYSVHAAVKAVVENAKTLPDFDLKPNLVTIENVEEVAAQMPKPPEYMFDVNQNIYLPIPGIREE